MILVLVPALGLTFRCRTWNLRTLVLLPFHTPHILIPAVHAHISLPFSSFLRFRGCTLPATAPICNACDTTHTWTGSPLLVCSCVPFLRYSLPTTHTRATAAIPVRHLVYAPVQHACLPPAVGRHYTGCHAALLRAVEFHLVRRSPTWRSRRVVRAHAPRMPPRTCLLRCTARSSLPRTLTYATLPHFRFGTAAVYRPCCGLVLPAWRGKHLPEAPCPRLLTTVLALPHPTLRIPTPPLPPPSIAPVHLRDTCCAAQRTVLCAFGCRRVARWLLPRHAHLPHWLHFTFLHFRLTLVDLLNQVLVLRWFVGRC